MPIVIVACLFLHYAAAMTIFGAATFQLAMARADAVGVDGRLRPVLLALWAVLVASGIALLMVNAGAMGGSWDDAVDVDTIATVLFETGFGEVWQWHLALILLAGVALWRMRSGGPWVVAAAMLILASLALVGHAAMREGLPGGLHRLNQMVHLFAAGAWIGGLVALLAAALALRSRSEAAVRVLHLFSRYGTVALALVLASGAVNTAILVGSLGGLTSSPYGRTLLAKLVLVASMIAIAGRNRYLLTPLLVAEPDRIGRRLCLSIAFEIAIGLAIVLVASLLGTLAPPNA